MRILIIEDEAPASRRLTKLVKEINPEHIILDTIESVEAGINWFRSNPPPDLIISDIQLSDDLSFEIFKQFPTDTPIIFTTAFDQYAIEAFEHMSIDYLLKPVRIEKLRNAIIKLENLRKPIAQFDPFQLAGLLKMKNYRERFLVYAGDNLISIPVAEIAYFYSEDGTSFLITQSGKRHIVSESLDKIEPHVDPQKFFRVNRQFLLSVGSIGKVASYFNQKLLVTVSPVSKNDIIISKLKATEFKNWLNS